MNHETEQIEQADREGVWDVIWRAGWYIDWAIERTREAHIGDRSVVDSVCLSQTGSNNWLIVQRISLEMGLSVNIWIGMWLFCEWIFLRTLWIYIFHVCQNVRFSQVHSLVVKDSRIIHSIGLLCSLNAIKGIQKSKQKQHYFNTVYSWYKEYICQMYTF